jgi:hypothetical protein
MSEVQYCHEIDEFENAPMKDEVFEFDSVKMNVNEMRKMHGIAECNTFYPLNEEELSIFAKNGIDGDALRKIKDNTYVNTYFNITYSISQNGRITKSFKY